MIARNRTNRGDDDLVLSHIDELNIDQLWLMAVDVGDGLTPPTLTPSRVSVRTAAGCDFKEEHNRGHRHSALGYFTPTEYAAQCRHTHHPLTCEIN